MTEYIEGGRRRLDRVLAPGFSDVEGVGEEELLRRRAEAEQEETDLSYVRRLLQGRLDLLRAEADRRASGEDFAAASSRRTDEELVAQLSRILADAPGHQRATDAHFVSAEPSRVGENRRALEAVIADVELSDVGHLDDRRLRESTARLAQMEQEISRMRASVQQVLDSLTAAETARLGRGARR